MGRLFISTLCIIGALGLSACDALKKPDVDKEVDGMNVIDATNLNDIMLTVADPNEAVEYFKRALQKEPERVDFRRGLAKSLVRAKRASEAVLIYDKLVSSGDATADDRVNYADALIRTNEWGRAEAQLDKVPPTHETYQRYRLEAMIADSNREWKKADSFYETAAGLTTQPAGVLNNWGYSKLTRGDYDAAEKLFLEAITYDKDLFTAKNNLVLARAAQRKYTLPVIQLTQIERAELLHTMAISAVKQGDIDIARGLLSDAIDTHPQHFDAAVRALDALDKSRQS
ncbi:MAG: tetratricopeptide repeat protein [Rhodobacteraceae bacterium]|nr:tetratricopeptide repeat protein [Paracoccaceae bacterium]